MSMLKRIGSYLGLVEEYEDEYLDLPPEDVADERPRAGPPMGMGAGAAHHEPSPRPAPSNVRRIAPAPSMEPPVEEPRSRRLSSTAVHVTNPTTFNDVEEVGEQFRAGVPVIMNLAGASESVAKRVLDFGSGLIFGLDGRIERVGERVFLLTPQGVEVSSEERRRLGERGFFNQA